ncbi:MAG: hypothetical protein IPI35_30275 [Deltaproteobacteria bacterium]|nr:hypothetical protein [Deltaproteobacteria bacterium]
MVADPRRGAQPSAEPDAEAIVRVLRRLDHLPDHPGERATRGTDIVLYLREDSRSTSTPTASGARARTAAASGTRLQELGEEQLNEPQVLWTKNPAEVTRGGAQTFVKQVSGDWAIAVTLHVRADAPIQCALLYIPGARPHDLNHVNGRRPLQLYARMVLILDEARELPCPTGCVLFQRSGRPRRPSSSTSPARW